MSGLEIVGLIAGIAGATAGGVSAVKDVRKDKAIQKSREVTQTRNMLQITEKACVTTGGDLPSIINVALVSNH